MALAMKVVKKGALIGLLAGAILGVAMAVWVAVPVKSPGSVSRFWEEVFGSLNIVAVVLTYVYTKFVHTVEFGDMIYPLLICIVLQSDGSQRRREKGPTNQPQRTPLISPKSSMMFPLTMALYFKSSVCPLAGRC